MYIYSNCYVLSRLLNTHDTKFYTHLFCLITLTLTTTVARRKCSLDLYTMKKPRHLM